MKEKDIQKLSKYSAKVSFTTKDKVPYKKLNARQKENYNFHVVSALLAQYGYSCLRLTDDWAGADFIANHIDGETFLKVQLKGRLYFDKKYCDKEIYIAFPHKNEWYLYPHDELLKFALRNKGIKTTDSWKKGSYSWPNIPKEFQKELKNKNWYLGKTPF